MLFYDWLSAQFEHGADGGVVVCRFVVLQLPSSTAFLKPSETIRWVKAAV